MMSGGPPFQEGPPTKQFENHTTTTTQSSQIRDVWALNLYEEFTNIRQVIRDYPYIAMDTEFPGVVAKPIGTFKSNTEFTYQMIRCNVDMLKLIQLGLSFMNDKGETPPPGNISTWQFNFKFDLKADMYAQDSIELLQAAGIQFARHEEEGIDPHLFAEMLTTSGIVLNHFNNIKWLSFHAGYDFCYLLKILTHTKLPEDEGTFFQFLRLYFPVIYDVKHLMRSCKSLKGGLQEVSEQLEIVRVGLQHQAGSDALLTGMTFFKMRSLFFEDHIDEEKYSGHLYGLADAAAINIMLQNGHKDVR